MKKFQIISEGVLCTKRLSVNHVFSKTTHDNYTNRVLLLGGSNFDLRLKRNFLKTILPERSLLCAYEPRGIGNTEQPDGDWTMLDYAEDALSVLDALEWPNAMIIGESFGAMTALHLAQIAPQRITEMVLASGSAGGAGGSSFDISKFLTLSRANAAKSALLLQDKRNSEIEIQDSHIFMSKLETRIAFEKAFETPSVTSGGYAKLLAVRSKHNAWEGLPNIDIPTLVVCGKFDMQAPTEVQKAMADKLPNASMETFSAGHGLLFSEPNVLDFIFDNWLEKLQITKEYLSSA